MPDALCAWERGQHAVISGAVYNGCAEGWPGLTDRQTDSEDPVATTTAAPMQHHTDMCAAFRGLLLGLGLLVRCSSAAG